MPVSRVTFPLMKPTDVESIERPSETPPTTVPDTLAAGTTGVTVWLAPMPFASPGEIVSVTPSDATAVTR